MGTRTDGGAAADSVVQARHSCRRDQPGAGLRCRVIRALGLSLPLAALVAVFAPLATTPAQARSRSLVLVPTADAYVRADRPAASFGHLGVLRVDGHPRARAYLRFRVAGRPHMAVASASLLIHVPRGPRSSILVSRTNGRPWTESGLSWRRAPALRRAVAVSRPSRGRWARIDVTSLIHRGGRVDLALTSTGRGSAIASREAGNRHAPRLLLRTYRDKQPGFPLRAAFYSTGYPEGWVAPGLDPATRYLPGLGFYDSRSRTLLGKHLRAIGYAGLAGGLAEWLGPGDVSDARLAGLLDTARAMRSRLRFGVEVPAAGVGDPSIAGAVGILAYLDRRRGREPAYLRVGGRPVVFVSLGVGQPCRAARRWSQANATVGTYLMLEAFPGYRSCAARPRGWYRRGGGQPTAAMGDRAYTISPGFFDAAEPQPRLSRDLGRWYGDVRKMRRSKARWQLVDSFNGWRQGTAVEVAQQWASPSGHGLYLDGLHARGALPAGRPGGDPAIAGAGDIACDPASSSYNGGLGTAGECRQRATSDLLVGQRLDAVLALGDLQYENGELASFRSSFESSWGRLGPLLRPAIGNHEYRDPAGGAAGYWNYFGPRAGPRDQGWYSFDIGGWHIIALNSNCDLVDGCEEGSPQERWLRADLAAHPAACTLAFFHHPLFAATATGNAAETRAVRPFWRDLYAAGAELVLNGHVHDYERFARQTPDGRADPSGGLREFVAGTGGKTLLPLGPPRSTSEIRQNTSFGVLGLVLHPTSYDWRFIPAAGGGFSDAGSESCR